jgi:hypothetical protein
MLVDHHDSDRGEVYFFWLSSAPLAFVAAALPACLAALPTNRSADAALLTALPAARFAWLAVSSAAWLCRVPAAFFPAVADCALLRFRSRVAAAFFAAADRSALVCAITYLLLRLICEQQVDTQAEQSTTHSAQSPTAVEPPRVAGWACQSG